VCVFELVFARTSYSIGRHFVDAVDCYVMYDASEPKLLLVFSQSMWHTIIFKYTNLFKILFSVKSELMIRIRRYDKNYLVLVSVCGSAVPTVVTGTLACYQ